jgi:AraC-like DNA-binding protein
LENPAVVEAKAKIEKTVKHMEEHYTEDLTREKLASIAGLNPEHYSRIFKQYKGISPIDYLTGLRIEAGKNALRASGSSVAEAAKEAGFSDPYHFSRRFKQIVGVAPAYYRGRQERRIVALYGYGYCAALGVHPVAADWSTIGACLVPEPAATGRLEAEKDGSLKRDVSKWKPDIIIIARDDSWPEKPASCEVVEIDSLEDPIYHQLPIVAGRLGLIGQASRWIKQYEMRKMQLREKVRARIGNSRVAILRVREQGLQLYGMLNIGYPLYRSLNVSPPDKLSRQAIVNAHYHSSVIEPEELPLYEADYLFVIIQPDEGAAACFAELQGKQEWLAYPAVAAGKIHQLDVNRWLAFDPVSIAAQMEEAAAILAGD